MRDVCNAAAVRPADVEEFLNEASLMKGFRHPNVVALIGICMEGNEPPKVRAARVWSVVNWRRS